MSAAWAEGGTKASLLARLREQRRVGQRYPVAVSEGASEAAQLQVRQLVRVEPGHLGKFAVGGFGETASYLRFVHGGDVCGAVSVRVAHFVVWAAEHIEQP